MVCGPGAPRLLAQVLVVLLCVAAGGCGGSGGDKPAPSPVAARGAQLFSQRCGECHTLSAARTTGTRGVNFDYRKITADDALFAIRNGGFSGGKPMPANIVSGEDAKAVAAFLAETSGTSDDGNLDDPAVARMHAAPAGSASGSVTAPRSGISEGFLRAAFDSAQELWTEKFADAGRPYRRARLVFFHTAIDTACGHQTARTGPFYCPPSHGVYLNTGFFDTLGRTFGLSSPFAPGYVTAHEVAHHVQQLLGLLGRVAAADARDPAGANARSVRVELQADCYAGIWLHYVARVGQLSDEDVADILRAAEVVGDDFQRNRAGVELAPETWTHGSSAQRVHWVVVGKSTGLPARCNTFAADAR